MHIRTRTMLMKGRVMLILINLLGYICTRSIHAEDTLVLKLGIIMGPCADRCDNVTIIKSKSGEQDAMHASVVWSYVDLEEEIIALSAVTDMCGRDLNLLILVADRTYHFWCGLLACRTKIVQWTRSGITENNVCDDVIQSATEFENKHTQHEGHCHPVAGVLASITSHTQWTSTYILVDSEHEKDLDDIVLGLSNKGMSVLDAILPDIRSTNFTEKFLSIMDYAIENLPNVTIVCTMECVKTLLTKAFPIARREVGRYAMRHLTRWLIVTYGDEPAADVLDVDTNLDNVVVIVLPNDVINPSSNFAHDINSLIQKVLTNIGSEKDTSDLATLRDLAIEALLNNIKPCPSVAIETLLWTKSGRRFQTVGHVQVHGPSPLHASADIFPNVKLGFNGRELLVSTFMWTPLVTKHGNNSFSGFCIDLLDHLAESLNFTYRLTTPPDGAWGSLQDNGHFNGLVGQMERNEVDLIVASLSIQPSRQRVMDFSYPFHYEPTKLVLKKMDPQESNWRSLLDPFSTSFLICIAMSLPTMSFVLFMLERVSPYYRHIVDRNSRKGLCNFADAFWYLYGALLTQGGEHVTEAWSGRTLLSFWWLFVIVIVATVGGNMIAFMAVSKEKAVFISVSDMINNDEYRWGTTGGTAFIDILKNSAQPDLQKVWDGIVRFNRTDPDVLNQDPEVHFRKVLTGKYGFFIPQTYIEIKMWTECNLVMTRDEVVPLQSGVGLPKNSPFTQLVSDKILKMHAFGLIHMWLMKHVPKRDVCERNVLREVPNVNLTNIQGAFYFVGIGVAVAGIVLLWECVRSWWRNRKHSNYGIDVYTATIELT